jgi:(1->4)-alpha-D-glucan 1-alpha-D-glucosylmutase
MKRIPASTYRLQLHKDFTFEDASRIADYLKDLGVSHVYSSPFLQATPGSMHGYDVVDHRRVNEEIGGNTGFEEFCRRLGEVGLGQVLDIVPNHMSLGPQNRYWWDVLENGMNSRYAGFFDIDWNSNEERLREKVLVPILSDQYGRVLAAGGIVVKRSGTRFFVETSGQTFPIAPETLSTILNRAAEYSRSDVLNFVGASYGRLPSAEPNDRRTVLERHRDKNVLQGLLDRLCEEERGVCDSVDRALRELNSNPDALDEFLSQQNYRLAYWKTADQQLGYRRFFDVNTLIGLRVEREYVFEETHALVLKWLRSGVLDGVRVDHPDGLRDPLEYFRRLRERAPEAWIIGEKILEPGEWMRESWPIEGTSGYDFLNMALGVLVDRGGVKRLGELYAEFTGDATPFPSVAHSKKIAVTQEALGSDVNRLATLFVEICEKHREERDFTRAEIRRAIREVAACFSVYRTYVVPGRNEINDEDRKRIERACECAKNNRTDIDGLLFDFMRDVLELKVPGRDESEFVARFQQFTSPVMAKGVEDTAFYCFNRLTATNEVGGDPDCGGFSVDAFHEYQQKMLATFPYTMTTLSTHDTKRADDVRTRLAVLSECPEEFAALAKAWSARGNRYKHGKQIDAGTEWFLFQTIIGAWPLTADRLQAYLLKAMREAKVRTSWVQNNQEYESALSSYCESILKNRAWVADIEAFVAKIRYAGRINSLSQTLMKHTAPGVPDLYQGGELWDLSLVDPDNRRPVDYERRRALLAEMQQLDAAAVMARMDDGLPKLWIIHRAFSLRNERRDWFGEAAGYEPVRASGEQEDSVIAYARGENVITVAQRFNLRRAGAWGNTTIALPEGAWANRLTGERIDATGAGIELGTLLREFPVALLTRE